MKKSITILTITVMLFALCLAFASCGNECEHAYFSDCDELCDKCGEAREIAVEHNYYGDCDSVCHSCGKEREATSEHSWKPATCTTPEACEGCGAVKGNLIEHSYTAVGYDDHYHYQMCSMCKKPNEESKEKHVLDDEYTCECGVEYTVKEEGEIETDAIVDLYNSKDQHIMQIVYEEGKITFYYVNYYNENGDVVRSENYDGSGELIDYFLSEYNENGDLIRENYCDSYGEVLSYALFHYDKNGNLAKKEELHIDGTPGSYNLYEYDERGNLLKNEDYNADGTIDDITTYEYDENDNLIKKKIEEYDENGALEYTEVSEYNENGDCVKKEDIYSDGSAYKYEYDGSGKLIKETQTLSDGSEFSIEYEYDEDGNFTKEIYEDSDGYEYVINYEYDENGSCTQKSFVSGNDYRYVTKYEYDEDGRRIKEIYEDSYGYEYVTSYEYDEDGKCTKEIYEDSQGVKRITEHLYDEEGNKIKSIQRFYDTEGNLVDIIVEEAEHNFSDEWQSDARGHWHNCMTEGCQRIDEIAEHIDDDGDNKCDICSYDFGYVYDAETDTYTVYSENGLEAVLALGGSIVLSNDIEMTDYLAVTKDVVLDLNGKTITADSFTAGCFFIIESGTLTVRDSQGDGKIEANIDQIIYVNQNGTLVVNGGSIVSDGYTVYVDGDATINGGMVSYIFGGGNDGDVYITVTGGTIHRLNLPSFCVTTITGGTFADNPNEYLSNEYYATYDSTTEMWTVVKHDGTIDTYSELQAVVNRGGSVRLGASIDLGTNNLDIPEDACVNLDLAGYTLSSASDVIYNFGTLALRESNPFVSER